MSLDLIRTTADKMITAIEQNLQDIRKERGIDQVNEKTSVLSELQSRKEQSGEKEEKAKVTKSAKRAKTKKAAREESL